MECFTKVKSILLDPASEASGVLPNLYYFQPVHPKVPKKPPLLRGEQSEPWISALLSLERSERSSLPTYPLPSAHKSATKTTTFERRAMQALKSAPLPLKQSKRSFPFYISLTGAFKSASENRHFCEASGAGSYKWLWPFIYLLHFSNQFETLQWLYIPLLRFS